ncbi:hypothetical protein U9M48_024692 [Paspalum notatum var. saurae]|uniref:Uncharacterized protein n=1 Tax=Paspalum notatum var. saurae TaxID=547442 RepID=A0AAQ3TR94_PASNO
MVIERFLVLGSDIAFGGEPVDMGQVRPQWRLPKVSRFLTSKPGGCKGGLDYWPHGGHPKIAWKLRRSSLHRGHPSPIFWP